MLTRRQLLEMAGLAGITCAVGSDVLAGEGGGEIGGEETAAPPTEQPAVASDSFKKQYDVVVVGGGIAGCAAALAAARAGQKTLLIEKTLIPGGMATAGLITWYSPICDGNGNKVTRGIAEEFLVKSNRYGPGSGGPKCWKQDTPQAREARKGRRYDAGYSAMPMVLTLDELMDAAGVHYLYDTRFCQAVVKGGRLVGLEVENTSGRGLIECGCCVDATGSATVAFRAGAPCIEGSNMMCMVVDEFSPGKKKIHKNWHGMRGLKKDKKKYRGIGGDEVTDFAVKGRRYLREEYAARIEEDGEQGNYPIYLPGIPQFRTTRKIQGIGALDTRLMNKPIDDSIGLTAEWHRNSKGQLFEIPLGSFLPKGVKGLVTSGRCMSTARGKGWSITRIIHTCVHTGELAGVVAAAAVEKKTTPDALALGDIHAKLDKLGILYKIDQIAAAPKHVPVK
jgi:FAD dependent oxidoreductase